MINKIHRQFKTVAAALVLRGGMCDDMDSGKGVAAPVALKLSKQGPTGSSKVHANDGKGWGL